MSAMVKIVCVTHSKRMVEHYLERQGELDTQPVSPAYCTIVCTGDERHVYVREDESTLEEFAMVWGQAI
jgi:hypothetical protein